MVIDEAVFILIEELSGGQREAIEPHEVSVIVACSGGDSSCMLGLALLVMAQIRGVMFFVGLTFKGK